jgi:hypothetical protein
MVKKYVRNQSKTLCSPCITLYVYLGSDPRMHNKGSYIRSVLQKAWWWLNTVETCSNKNILLNKLVCLTGIYTFCELHKHIKMNNVKLRKRLFCSDLPFKAYRSPDGHTGLTFNNCTLCPHCIYMLCIYLRKNSDLCHLQHKLIGFYNRDEKCLQRGREWVFK